MKKLITPNRDRLEREVINWLIRLTSGEATPDDFTELAKWRGRSPAHNHAYQKISALWDQLDKPLLAWHQQSLLTENSLPEQCIERPQIVKRPSEKKRLKGLLAAAIFATLILVGLFPDYVIHPFADFRTLIGERTSITLADGSIAHLNTNTAINIDFSSDIRHIELLHGEAEFEVAHDTHKPFIVSSGAIQTQAIGTKFIVRLDDSSGAVTLLQGRVQTSSVGSIKSDRQVVISLASRDQATFNNGRFSAINQVDITEADTWKNGRLQMNFVTLEQVVTEISRYRRGAVKLSAPQLAHHKINAVIDLKQIDVWLEALETTLPIRVLHLGPWVLLRSKT
jgi:transmembrane sensor